VLKSTFHGETAVAFSPLVVDEITIVGSRCGPFRVAIDALAAGRIDVQPLIDGIYPLEQFAQAFQRARSGRKQILAPGLAPAAPSVPAATT
jgi:threonine dehydrogenase-like Zn-dependent dehydrogenase